MRGKFEPTNKNKPRKNKNSQNKSDKTADSAKDGVSSKDQTQPRDPITQPLSDDTGNGKPRGGSVPKHINKSDSVASQADPFRSTTNYKLDINLDYTFNTNFLVKCCWCQQNVEMMFM